MPDTTSDPELTFLKDRYRQEFRLAFHAVLEALSPEERSLLKLHYLDGLTMDQIAKLCCMHKSNVSRALARARARILEDTRRCLATKLKLETSEVDSVLGFVRSRLDVSIRRFLEDRSV
jgi:RNA polymerase sigma-70 factor (ECF subfamily)